MALENLMTRMLSGQSATDTLPAESSASETPTEEASPVITRTREVIDYMLTQATKNGVAEEKGMMGTFKRIMPRLISEAIEELSEKQVPEEAMEYYMEQTSALAHYAATGERIDTLPNGF